MSLLGASTSHCEPMVDLARRIATQLLDPLGLEAFLAIRLIPLDQCPGGAAYRHRRGTEKND